MARLKMLRDASARLKPAARYLPNDKAAQSRARDARVEWRSWYKTSRWQRLRWKVLVRDLFTCQWPGCGRVESNTSLLVADHKRPHRGDEALFWDEGNLWCLCKPCHDRLKQRDEAADRQRGA
ncbi:HNH endonuclease [Rhodobacter sp. NSM]|uniref:HNH endonuclease n=1 Tax=Rhodobacter sp. NSM TaxID=3457501 RepID=UPI003FCFC9BB